MKKILFLIGIVFCINSKAQTPYVAIPDSNFVHYLKTIVPSAFKGDSLNTSNPSVTSYTGIICSSRNIANLTGIQYFTSLISLDCSSNLLTSIPSLPNSLTQLFCQLNNLSSLPPLPNSLQFLVCEDNQLTSLPSLPNTLYFLDALNNNISCFPVFPSSISTCTITSNPFNCLPNFVLPAMNSYTTTPLCASGNSNGCPAANTTNIEHITKYDSQINVYPNPVNSIVHIEAEETAEIKLCDLLGNKILTTQQNEIDVSNLANGVYFLRINNYTQKIIVQH